jgi:hypothetical protein
MNNTHDIIDDRIDVVCRGFMGLTVTCARCHDHKFDPISQADYYSLYGVFRSCREPLVPPLLEKPPETKEYQQFAQELATREKRLRDFVESKHRELVIGARSRVAEYLLAVYVSRDQPPDDDFMLLADKGDLNPAMITRWRVCLEANKKGKDPIWFPWHVFASIPEKEFSKQNEAVLQTIRATPGLNPLVLKEFPSKPASMKDVAERYGKVFANIDKQWQTFVSEARSKKLTTPTKLENADAESLRIVLYGPHSPADAPVELDWGFLSLFPDRATQDDFKKLIKDVEVQSEKGPPRSMVIADSTQPFEPQIFLRGQPNRLGEQVPRQFIKVVDPSRKPFQQGSGRLELAREIISPQNPLTARVLVNRVWMHHLGNGLVSTPSDFGLRGATPTHPELLDFLARDFMDKGWSLKRLHRLIMTSAVYQQSSNDRADARAVDPENQLLWKMNRQRLEFELLHDSLLAVSGQLDLAMGGPAVPLFIGKNRRAIYGYIDRLDFPSLLTTFDMPNPAASVPQRSLTTIASQALYLMNGPLVRQAAERILSLSAIKNQKNASEKVDAIYRILFQRLPKENERNLALAYLRGSGSAGAEPSHDRWVDYVHGLLMTNEFAFVD